MIDDAEAAVFLPAAPDPQITLPTTTYKTKRPFPRNLLPADYFRVRTQHAHWPLVVMLVLTQLSVGAFAAGLLLEHWLSASFIGTLRPLHAAEALAFGLLALDASLFHLGRPHYAFRAVLGLRHSWLSREIVVFGVFAGLASLYAGSVVRGEQLVTLVGLERGREWRRCRLLLDHDLCVHAARMLELHPNGHALCAHQCAAWASLPFG